jgi:hypothetical protein
VVVARGGSPEATAAGDAPLPKWAWALAGSTALAALAGFTFVCGDRARERRAEAFGVLGRDRAQAPPEPTESPGSQSDAMPRDEKFVGEKQVELPTAL